MKKRVTEKVEGQIANIDICDSSSFNRVYIFIGKFS